jgi:hypothetical protein
MLLAVLSSFLRWPDMKKEFHGQKGNAKARGIEFLFTYEQWLNWWITSGKLEQRGKGRGKYCMMRKGDVGPYSIENVFCGTNEQNAIDCHQGRTRSKETRELMSRSHKGLFDGDKNPRARTVVTPYGIWTTAKEAAKYLGVAPTTVEWRCKNHKSGFAYLT